MSFGYIPDFKHVSFVKDLYLRGFGFPYAPRRNEARLVLNLLRPKIEESILDLGCGEGVWTNEVAKTGATLFGIDISRPDLSKARCRVNLLGNTVKLIGANAQSLPFTDNSFDRIFSISTLEHILDDFQALCEAHRILKPEGIIVVSVPTDQISFVVRFCLSLPDCIKKIFLSSFARDARSTEEYHRNFNKKFKQFRVYEIDSLAEKIQKAGFKIENIEYSCILFGSLALGLLHVLRIFEWQKRKIFGGYNFTNEIAHAIFFPFFYTLFRLDDLFRHIKKSGIGIVCKARKINHRARE